MMPLVVLVLAVAVVFLIVDVLWLRFYMQPLFIAKLGDMLRPDPLMGVAGIFYILYVFGIVWFAALPGLRAGSLGVAGLNGFFLGLVAYGTYELTNLATLRGWHAMLSVIDIAWGAALTALTAVAAVAIVRAIYGAAAG